MAGTLNFPYLHGFNKEEQDRLYHQAEFGEQSIYRDVDFSRAKNILEVGSGVGAQTAILLRRFPKVKVTGIDLNDLQLDASRVYLSNLFSKERFEIQKMDAQSMDFSGHSFDGAFLCWILEHVPDPSRVLGEVRRVLKPGARVYVTEVMNSTFFLDPYSPNTWKYWMSFNDYQYDGAGDPFIGAKLGHLLNSAGFKNVQTQIKSWHLDSRDPEQRREVIAYWKELLLSAADRLIEKGYTTKEIVSGMEAELKSIQSNPSSVFLYSFMQATATVN